MTVGRWAFIVFAFTPLAAPSPADQRSWLRTARVYLLDAYQYPFSPQLEFDAEATARLLEEMGFNTIRFPAIGMYATVPRLRFPVFPGQGERDLLAEMIRAAKPRGIRVVVYVGTGHKVAWSIVTRHHPEYAQRTKPGGLPARSHFFTGEDFGTVCWNTPYREAYLEMLSRILKHYDVDGIYFDRWTPRYFWPGLGVCYCDGCRSGFRAATGRELPYHEEVKHYSAEELAILREYHAWYRERLVEIKRQALALVKAHKNIPLIANINNAQLMVTEDPRLLEGLDAFLYERTNSLLERAEGVSLMRAAGLYVWPYVGAYHNWPRLAEQGYDYTQEIFTSIAFGGAPIVAQPTGYLTHPENRHYITEAFAVLKKHEEDLPNFENVPYVGVVWASQDPPGFAQRGRWWGVSARRQGLGAFAACLQRHLQVSSIWERALDDPATLSRYRVIYLPGTAYLSPQRVANLKEFVASGGGLVVSYGSSLYDAAGRRRERFALEDLIRVRPRRRTDELDEMMHTYSTNLGGPNDLYLLSRPHSGLPSQRWQGRLVPLWYYEPVELLEGARVLMDIVTGPGRSPFLPGMTAASFGKGRVVYCASALESLFADTNERVLGDLLSDLVRYASGYPNPFELEAPESLVANLTGDGSRRVLHLVNWAGCDCTGRLGSRYHLPPVENAVLRLPKEADHVFCYPTPCQVRTLAGKKTVRLPRIQAYLAVRWRQ